MKTIKLLSLMLVVLLAMSLTLTGCSEEPTAPSGKPSSSKPAPEIPETPEIPEQGGELPEESIPPLDPEGPEPIIPPGGDFGDPDDEIGEDFQGGVNEKSYQNGYIGIACKLSDDWQIYSNQLGAATGHTQFYDIQAENSLNNASMNITLMNLSRLEQDAYRNAPDEEVVDIALMGSDALIDSYAQVGITVKSMDKATVTFLGQERWCIYTLCDMLGANYYIVQLFEYDLGPVGATITVAGFTRQAVQDVLSLFRPYNP